jgi:hypothetical protein
MVADATLKRTLTGRTERDQQNNKSTKNIRDGDGIMHAPR